MAAGNEVHIWAVLAASGMGKGLWIKAKLAELQPRRVVVWDFLDEYGAPELIPERVASIGALVAAMKRAGPGRALRVRYVPRATQEKMVRKEFEAVCAAVYAWGNCTFVAEELSNVTTPSWAPHAWRKMTTSGRHSGVHIIGTAQMPALVDKAFLGNASLIHVGPLHEHLHRAAVERSMDLEPGALATLVKFQWVELDRRSGTLTTGVILPPGLPADQVPSTPTLPRRRGTPRDGAGG